MAFWFRKSALEWGRSFKSNGLKSSEDVKKVFQDGGDGIPIDTVLLILDLQVTLTLPTKFQINWPFGSGVGAKIIFQDGRHGCPLGFPNKTILAFLMIYKSSRCFLPSFKLILVQEKRKIDFQNGRHGCQPWFPIGTIFAIFNVQVTPMLPSKFQDHWPFGSGEEAQNRLRWPPWRRTTKGKITNQK